MKVLHVFTISTTPESFFDGQFGYLADKEYHITYVTNDEGNVDFAKRNHVLFRRVGIERSINPMADLRAISNLISIIKTEKFEIVVGHTPKGAMVAMFASMLAGVKTRVYYRHGLIYTTATGIKRRIFKFIEQATARCATHVVNVSPSLSELAVKDKLNSAEKQTVFGAGTCGGIDAAHLFNPASLNVDESTALRNKLKLTADTFVVGFCGRLCKDKGITELIEGFMQFQSMHPSLSTKLLLVGPYDERDILPKDVHKEIDGNPDIITTGMIEKERLPYYYSLMDVFVFPSYREGFGMCIIEASAMEVPVLVSRSHGCIDSIRENETGRYIDISAGSIAEGISGLYNDKETRRRLGQGGRQFAVGNFDYSVMWPKILDFYKNIEK